MAHEHHSVRESRGARPSDHDPYGARPHPEFVVLELGDTIGALIVYMDASMHGVEIEISPAGEDHRRSHKEVLERRSGERPAYTAVFDHLPAGSYTLWVDGLARARQVQVTGARAAELHWETAA